MSNKIGLVFGISGQDGSYLSELLLSKGYIVYGMIRRNSSDRYPNIEHIRGKLNLIYGDLTDFNSINSIFNKILTKEDFEVLEVYSLAAQSHVALSFEIPIYTGMVDAIGTLNILEAIRNSGVQDKIKFYQASTSELYGRNQSKEPRNEETPFYPASPYGVAKLYGYWIVKNYRESYNIFACNGILFNHTSPRRTENFACRKITLAAANIAKGKQTELILGNLNAVRDLGHSRDFVEGMWLMLQQDKCKDYVLSTQEAYTIRQLVEMAFSVVEMKIEWEGEGLNEIGKINGNVIIRVSKEFFRPCEVDFLLGDSTLARQELEWKPEYSTADVVKEMVLHDLQ